MITPTEFTPCPDVFIHTFSPDEAQTIVDATHQAGYNFRRNQVKANNGGMSPTTSRYAEHMKEGSWFWTDSPPIRLSSDRQLCSDGVHRLTACARSGIPLKSLVLVGDDWRAYMHEGMGKKRSLAEFMTHNQIPNANPKVAIVRGMLLRDIAATRNIQQNGSLNILVTDDQVIDCYTRHSEIVDWAVDAAQICSRRIAINNTAVGIFLVELALGTTQDEAATFHEALIGWKELGHTDPMAKFILAAEKAYSQTRKRYGRTETLAALYKVWTLRSLGREVLTWKAPSDPLMVTRPSGINEVEISSSTKRLDRRYAA